MNVGLTGVEKGWWLFLLLGIGGVATLLVGFMLSRWAADGHMIVGIQVPATIAAAILMCVQFQVSDPCLVIAAGAAFRIAYAVQDVAEHADIVVAGRRSRCRSLCASTGDAERRRAVLRRERLCSVGEDPCPYAGGDRRRGHCFRHVAALRHFPRRLVCGERTNAKTYSMPDGQARLLLGWSIAAMLLRTLNRLLLFSASPPLLPRSGIWLLAGFCLGSMAGPLRKKPAPGRLLARTTLSALSMIVVVAGVPGLVVLVAGAVLHGMALSAFGVQLWAATSRRWHYLRQRHPHAPSRIGRRNARRQSVDRRRRSRATRLHPRGSRHYHPRRIPADRPGPQRKNNA